MIQDAENTYSQDQAVTATAASENYLNHGPLASGNAGRNLGVGAKALSLVVLCTEDMTDSGSDSTVTVTIETDDNAAFSSAKTTRTVGAFAATSPAGTRLVAQLADGDIDEQYSQLKYTVAGGNLTTGKFTSFLTDNVDAWRAYADNVTID